MGQDQESYIKTLQQEIEQAEKDKLALRQELTATGGQDTPETPAQVIKKSLLPNAPEYIQNLDALAHSADSESVRMQANKLLIEWAVTDKLVTGDDDADAELKDLLKKITKKGAK